MTESVSSIEEYFDLTQAHTGQRSQESQKSQESQRVEFQPLRLPHQRAEQFPVDVPQTPAPEPLRAPMPKPEPYPVDALGDVLGAAAQALHETVKAPLALCCQSVLASASLAVQAHFDVLLPWGEKKPLSLRC